MRNSPGRKDSPTEDQRQSGADFHRYIELTLICGSLSSMQRSCAHDWSPRGRSWPGPGRAFTSGPSPRPAQQIPIPHPRAGLKWLHPSCMNPAAGGNSSLSLTSLYKPLQGYTRLYKAIQGYTRLYKAIQGYTRLYKAIQAFTE